MSIQRLAAVFHLEEEEVVMTQRKALIRGSFILFAIFVLSFVCPQQSSAETGKERVRVLALLPLTGPAAPHGKYLLHGFELYQEDFPDSNISLSVQDSQSNPKTAMSILMQEIARQRPSVVISAMSHVSKPVIIKTDEEGIFAFLVLSTSEKIIEGHPNVQRIFPPTINNIEPIALYARERFGKISILYSNEEFGLSNQEKFISIYSSGKNTVLQSIGYSPGDKDVRTLVQKALIGEPQAVYVTGFESTYMGLIRTLKELGYGGTVLADSAFCNPQVQKAIGEASEGVIFSGTEVELTQPPSPSVHKFVERYKKKYGRDAMHFPAVTYDTLAIIEEISKSGGTFSQETVQSIQSWQGIAFKTQFLPGGECRIPCVPMLHQGGKNILIDSH